ncbi:hypothetical protein [Kouleothrix sp.]|uniref:hypothetical protein n=1 Tax=Kouleothrix sp. TaxID=2779161 RepID=UPI00391B05C1
MRKIAIVLLAALALAACGVAEPGGASAPTAQPATVTPAGQPTSQPAPTPAPTTEPAASATPAPSPVARPPGAGGTSVRPPDELVQAAQLRLAAYLKRPPAQIELQSANREEWPDGALGCPADGMAYPQVVTPGFRLVFTSDNQAQSYEVHTGMGTSQLILCADGQPADLGAGASVERHRGDSPAPLDDAGRAIADLARAALARELQIAESDVQMVAAEPVEWNDSSLGCPSPGQAALQVITPGYRLVLSAQGRTYEYHTDQGKRLVRCEAKRAP